MYLIQIKWHWIPPWGDVLGGECLFHSCTTIHSSQLVSDQCIWKLKLWRALYPLSAHRFDLLPHLLYLQCWYSVVMVFHNFHKRLPHDTHKGIIKSFNSSEEHEESSLLLEMPFNWHRGQKSLKDYRTAQSYWEAWKPFISSFMSDALEILRWWVHPLNG